MCKEEIINVCQNEGEYLHSRAKNSNENGAGYSNDTPY